ncbi:BTAD domain-containing putative transcriptional regulator [Nocardia sp. NPDC051030]|uniref:BTAD domain-containing putative transcriptional regulator n=1 Tax=Nocardia sp. NPDC051030 TaxID=3155162 RepID=UPI00343D9E5A
MSGAELRVLGPLRLSVAGREAVFGTPMQRAVLGRLIVARGQVVSVERMIDDLWAGQPPAKAIAVLQVHIHNLRRLFEPDRPRRAPSRYIVSESSGYALKMAENAVDAWHFEEQLRSYQELVGNPETRPDPAQRRILLETAMTQWHGPALEAFTETDWAHAEADRLTDLYLTAVELDAHTKLELGCSGQVVLELRQQFEDHPGREGIVRLLALAQYQLGQQLEALTTIRRSREFLSYEFGIDPGPALRQLETAILNHSAELATAGGATTPLEPAIDDRSVVLSGSGPMITETPTATGYIAELSQLLTLADAARGGSLRLVWVAGEAGIGKSTLAEAALSGLAASGWTVATGSCPEIDGAPPAWGWSEILADLDTVAATGAALHSGDAFSISRTVTERCRRATTSEPVALLLEDVHRADAATLQVLRQVTNWLREEPVLILVTARRSEAGPGAHNTAAALAQYTASWMELHGLDLAGTRQVALEAGLPLSDELLARLHERTGGNPLFVRELAKLTATQGNLDEVPDSIRELIDDRIAQLPAGVTEVLQHISIWGAGSELGILALASGMAENTLIDLIAAAEVAGLVSTGRAGRVSFEHALIRDAVYLGIPVLRRGRMHWAALELLTSHADSYPALARDPDVLARHAMLGASAETARAALGYVRAAACRRMNRHMRGETVRLLRAAMDLHELAGHDAPHADRTDRIALLDTRCALVGALAYANRHREARDARTLALDLAEQLADETLIAQALTCWRAPVIWPIREWREPDHRIRQALSRALARYGTGDEEDLWTEGRSPEMLVRLLVTATFETGLDGYAEGQGMARRALGVARASGDAESICAALNAVAYLEFDYGDEFWALTGELEGVAMEAGLAEYEALAHYLGYRAAVAHADLREAARRAAHAVECADEGQLQPLLDMVSCFGATMELLRGDVDLAERLYEQFGKRITRAGIANVREAQLFCAVAVGWARGDLSGLADRLGDTTPVLPSTLSQAHALALLHAGDREGGRKVYEQAGRAHNVMYPVLMSAVRARTALELGDIEAIRELYEFLSPYTGTVIGVETGMTEFGPMDTVLADLAEALGDSEAAAIHRERAGELLERIRTELPDTGNTLLRAA